MLDGVARYPPSNEPVCTIVYPPQDHSLGSKGCMCVWDLSNPTVPHAVLISEGSPAVCCWGSAPATNLVFAGEGGDAIVVCVDILKYPLTFIYSDVIEFTGVEAAA